MTAVAVVKIKIDDTEFKNFLASTKGLKLNAGVNIKGQRAAEEKHRKQQKKQWLEEDRHYKSFTKTITEATKSLAKWTAITGGLGIAGAYGAGKLGNSIEQQRYSARGLGISTAEQSAFKLNYRGLVDTETMLGKVADTLTDYSKRSSLYAAGLTESDIAGKSAAQVAEMLIPLIKEKFEKNPTEQGAQAFRLLDLVGGMTDLRRLQAARADEIAAIQEQNKKDKEQIILSEQVQQDWVKLSQQATRAGQQIEVEFVKALVKVAPELTKLSEALIVDIRELAGSNGLKDGVHELSKGIHALSDYLGSESFKSDIKGFTEMVHNVAGFLGLGDQSDKELAEFDKAIANGEVDYSFKTPPTDDEKRQIAHEWYQNKPKSSWFNPQENFRQFEEQGRNTDTYKFLDKMFPRTSAPSAPNTGTITINNNSSADVMYNMHRLGIIIT